MDLKTKLFGTEDERAVSPVIGVVLMVAVTVILAAVIAAFVMDMGDGLGSEAQAGVTVDSDDDTAQVTWASQGNTDDITVEATVVNPSEISNDIEFQGSGTIADGATRDLDSVGVSKSFTLVDGNAGNSGADVLNGGDTEEVDLRIVATARSDDTNTVVHDSVETVVVEGQS